VDEKDAETRFHPGQRSTTDLGKNIRIRQKTRMKKRKEDTEKMEKGVEAGRG